MEADIKLWPFKVEPGQGDKPIIVVTAQGEQPGFLMLFAYSIGY